MFNDNINLPINTHRCECQESIWMGFPVQRFVCCHVCVAHKLYKHEEQRELNKIICLNFVYNKW